jgi:hypothetical protein
MKSDLERFMEKVSPEPNSGCWLWMGFAEPPRRGYGYRPKFKLAGRAMHAARVSFEFFIGRLGSRMACHTCDVSMCVNPAHLFAGTQADNMRDCAAKGRTWRRPRPPGSKRRLTYEDVEKIRAEYAAGGVLQRELGERYGYRPTHISRIILGKVWGETGHQQMVEEESHG